MIDEDRTMQLYGYTSDELTKWSKKPIVRVCESCGRYGVVMYFARTELCKSCSQVKGQTGRTHTKKTLLKMSKSASNRTRRTGWKLTEEWKIRASARQQGISYEKWDGYAGNGEYCHKFDEGCRERNRQRYGRACFICGKDETENGRRLSVHHVDMSKSQGCDGEKWKLVPLCQACHGRAHSKMWQARIEYLLRRL